MVWINVDEELPTEYILVWVRFEHGGVNQAYIDGNGKWQYGWKPTHWSEYNFQDGKSQFENLKKPIDTIIDALDILEKRVQNNANK
ncbi:MULTISPECIES: DUF551 domain-containing protein [unclassified Pedobacter]|uniref:DUF551 domain-containing protein n=1 Tax=unclassified Pedobacter TaxID=2628915 RepID=UPI00141FE623|nr:MULTISPECIES: DUF551 domain-containing protein [unclassified Pedobacter]NII83484.1 hypothetical protein [Pedobacter sp. SG908]NMN37348.1 hypothetical protein [Pedobacter sp. SG918]